MAPDWNAGDSHEGRYRRAPPFGAKTGKGLRELAAFKGGLRQDVCGNDVALTAASMDANFRHPDSKDQQNICPEYVTAQAFPFTIPVE